MSIKFNSNAKDLIRSVWAKDILNFLTTEFNSKLVYLGLPGEEAKDIEEWINFLDKVFAFQNDDDRYPDAYIKLLNKLDSLEQLGLLSTYNVFNGFIETVVTQGYDDNNSLFELNDVITLYNLDFCNQIDFPIEVQLTEPPYVKEIFKFDAIENLLQIQRSLENQNKRFVLFLTIHCSYKDIRTKELVNSKLYREYLEPRKKVLKGLGHFKNAYALRKIVLRGLTEKFNKFGFVSQIFPTIFYEGDRGTPMLFFSIVGKDAIENELSSDLLEAQITSHLRKKFISVQKNQFVNLNIEQIDEEDNVHLNPIDYFKGSDFYANSWKK